MVETQWPTPPCGVIREPHLQIRPTPRAELMKTCNRGAIHQDAGHQYFWQAIVALHQRSYAIKKYFLYRPVCCLNHAKSARKRCLTCCAVAYHLNGLSQYHCCRMQSARRAESIGAGSRSPVEHRVGVTGIAERMPYARCAETSTDLRLELPLAREAL
eukprot:1190534-Prorocentrum_minimum.AAC.1